MQNCCSGLGLLGDKESLTLSMCNLTDHYRGFKGAFARRQLVSWPPTPSLSVGLGHNSPPRSWGRGSGWRLLSHSTGQALRLQMHQKACTQHVHTFLDSFCFSSESYASHGGPEGDMPPVAWLNSYDYSKIILCIMAPDPPNGYRFFLWKPPWCQH